MAEPHPPIGRGPLAKREARLAWSLLLPTLTAVALGVVLPLLQDGPRLEVMATAAAEHGDRDAADRLVDLVLDAAGIDR